MLQLSDDAWTGEGVESAARGAAALSHVRSCLRVLFNGEYPSKIVQNQRYNCFPRDLSSSTGLPATCARPN